jgi:dephospho-CoA kinase
MLTAHGAHVIDVDAVGRDVIAAGGRAEAEVLAEFGPSIATTANDGDRRHIDRAALARAVFGKPDELFRLTAISHPAINAELAERIDALPANGIVVLDMAILVESNLGRLPDGRSYSMVVVVEAPAELRVQRAVARGMQPDDVRARIASQASDDERRAVADVVIANDGDLASLTTAVADLWSRLNAWL